jgi:seryl-tRNA synthetase
MHDLTFFRNNLEAIREKLEERGFELDVASFQELDRSRRAALTDSEQLKAARNAASQEISKLRKEGIDTAEKQQQIRALGDRIAGLDERATKLEEEFRDLLARIPNVPHESVPRGRSSDDNVEVKRWGDPRRFDYEPKAHWDLGPELGVLDLERAAKVTGARFAVYWGMGARLERALINFMLDVHTREHGYREVLPPFLINSASMYGTGQLPKFEEDSFHCQGYDFWLAPTAEVPVTNLFRDETLSLDQLPISLCAYTPCFRSEAGSYGRDVRGSSDSINFRKWNWLSFPLRVRVMRNSKS